MFYYFFSMQLCSLLVTFVIICCYDVLIILNNNYYLCLFASCYSFYIKFNLYKIFYRLLALSPSAASAKDKLEKYIYLLKNVFSVLLPLIECFVCRMSRAF